MNDLLQQGMRAWKRYEQYHGVNPTQPSMSTSQVLREGKKLSIILAHCHGILAVYIKRETGTRYRCQRVRRRIAALYASPQQSREPLKAVRGSVCCRNQRRGR